MLAESALGISVCMPEFPSVALGYRMGGIVPPMEQTTNRIMKITRKSPNGERREALLKEYFLTASLIALLKRVGEEAAKAIPRRAAVPVPVRIRR